MENRINITDFILLKTQHKRKYKAIFCTLYQIRVQGWLLYICIDIEWLVLVSCAFQRSVIVLLFHTIHCYIKTFNMVHWIDQSFVHYSQFEMAKLTKSLFKIRKLHHHSVFMLNYL